MKTPLKFLFYGLAIGIAIPFAIDIILFGTPTPCHSLKTFEDGSSIQACGTNDGEALKQKDTTTPEAKVTTTTASDPIDVVYQQYNHMSLYEDGSYSGQDLQGNKVVGCVASGLCQD